MIARILWAFLGLIIAALIAAGLVGVKITQFKAMGEAAASMVMPPEPVNVAEVREELWQPRMSAVGSVVADQGTVVSTEADGIVREIRFKDGSHVKAGDVLVQLDTDIEVAQLREAQAAAELAAVNFKRSKELIDSRSVSQQELDQAQVTLKQALAKVENLRGVIARKTVRAPFAGKLGIRQVNVGQFLPKGSPVVSLQSLDPVRVEFSMPQQRLGELAEGLKVVVTTDAYTSSTFEGSITAINPDLDFKTRSVRVQATLPNPDGRLRPGMFVSVDVVQNNPQKVLMIPSTAVLYAPYGDSIFLIEEGKADDGTTTMAVRQQFVRLGARQGDFVIVRQGLKAGDRVVSTGVFKLRPGMEVVIDNTLAPEFKLEPAPRNT